MCVLKENSVCTWSDKYLRGRNENKNSNNTMSTNNQFSDVACAHLCFTIQLISQLPLMSVHYTWQHVHNYSLRSSAALKTENMQRVAYPQNFYHYFCREIYQTTKNLVIKNWGYTVLLPILLWSAYSTLVLELSSSSTAYVLSSACFTGPVGVLLLLCQEIL